MGRRERYFIGSLFSRQALYAYAIGSGATTALLLTVFTLKGIQPQMRLIHWGPEFLMYFVEMYIRVSIPVWVPPITWLELGVVGINTGFGLLVLFYWSENYRCSTF